MTERERDQPAPEYWNADDAIGEVRPWPSERYTLRLKAHVAEELYRRSEGAEIVPLKQARGVRTYTQAKPYILIPDIRLGVRLFPTTAPTKAVGLVTSSERAGMRHEEIGQAQGWYYHEDRVLVLWEAYLFPRYRGPNVAEDPNSYALWEGFERFLVDRFPLAQQIVTTHDDPEYQTDQYQDFLQRMGYRRLNPAAFAKPLLPREVQKPQ